MAIYMCDIHPARTSAAKHFSYIMRDGAYKRNGGLMTDDDNKSMVGNGNLPAWAIDNPKSFWKADDKFESGNKYREAVIALPNELPASELVVLVKNIQEKICPNSAYAYAIHDSIGSLSGKKNTHVHLMFCEREIELNRPEPDKENYFKKSRTLKRGGISGGYRKGKNFGAKRKQWLKDSRKAVEECINEALERNGIDARVTSKSLKDQRKEYVAKHANASAEELAAKFHRPAPKLGKNRIHLFKNQGIKSDRFLEYEDVKKYNDLSDEIFGTQCKLNDAAEEKKKLEKDALLLSKEYEDAVAEEKQKAQEQKKQAEQQQTKWEEPKKIEKEEQKEQVKKQETKQETSFVEEEKQSGREEKNQLSLSGISSVKQQPEKYPRQEILLPKEAESNVEKEQQRTEPKQSKPRKKIDKITRLQFGGKKSLVLVFEDGSTKRYLQKEFEKMFLERQEDINEYNARQIKPKDRLTRENLIGVENGNVRGKMR